MSDGPRGPDGPGPDEPATSQGGWVPDRDPAGPKHAAVSGPPARAGAGFAGWIWAGRAAIGLLAAIVLVVTGVQWSIKSRADEGIQARSVRAVATDDSNITTPSRSGAVPNDAPDAPAAVYPPENVLLLGSDTRSGANAEVGTDESIDPNVAQSDTLMIAHVSADRQHVTVVSIPRDLEIDAPTCNRQVNGQPTGEVYPVSPGEIWKITNAYAVGGPACTVRAVQQLTGLRIDRVIGIDFVGFKAMVDALGGIRVNVCRPIVDAELNTVAAQAGEQVVNGDTALSLVRARKVEGDPSGDLGRIRRQQVVLSSMLRQVTSAGTLLNPATLDAFLQAFVQNTYTDNVTIDDLVALAESFGSLDPSTITFFTLPTEADAGDSDALELDPAVASAVFGALANDEPLPGEPAAATSSLAAPPSTGLTSGSTPSAPSPAPPPVPAALTVGPEGIDLEVVNVAGRTGVASQAAEGLNAVGFDVGEDDLELPVGPIVGPITVEFSAGNEAAALTVAAAVEGATLLRVDGLGTRVRLLLGTAYQDEILPVRVGDPVPGALAQELATLPAASSTAAPEASLASSELTPVNAADALCA